MVVAIELDDTCREVGTSFEGEEVFDTVPVPARGGVEGPALAFGGLAVWGVLALVAVEVLDARRDMEALDACFAAAGRAYSR